MYRITASFILLLILLFTGSVAAQNQAVEPYTVRVHIIGSVSLIVTSDVDFGDVISGNSYYMDASGNLLSGGSGTTGSFEVVASLGTEFEINWTDADLRSQDSRTSVDFIPTVRNSLTNQMVYQNDLITLTSSDRMTFTVHGRVNYIPDSFSGTLTTTNPGGRPMTVTVTVVSI